MFENDPFLGESADFITDVPSGEEVIRIPPVLNVVCKVIIK